MNFSPLELNRHRTMISAQRGYHSTVDYEKSVTFTIKRWTEVSVVRLEWTLRRREASFRDLAGYLALTFQTMRGIRTGIIVHLSE